MNTPLPIPLRSNAGVYDLMGNPKVVNAYAELGGTESKGNFSLLPVAGMKLFGSENGTGCRGMLFLEDESFLYSVQGAQLFKIESDTTATSLGFIAGTDHVSMARNDASQQELMIVSDGKSYVVKDGALSFKQYSQTTIENEVETKNILAFAGVTYVGGYFVLWLEDGRFFVSDLQSTTVDELSFATAESDPDGLIAAHGSVNTLYLIGPDTTEIWSITGADFPLAPVRGAQFKFGTRSPHTVKDFANGVVWVGSDNVVYMVNGYNFTPISSDEVSRLIEAMDDKNDLVAFVHTRGQHKFYTLQGDGWTREYDSLTQSWHDREGLYGVQWHGMHCQRAWNKDIYGDRITGELFEADYDLFTDDSTPMTWGFDTPIIHDSPNGLSFEQVDSDMETGDGQDFETDGNVMVSISNDNTRIFRDERILSLGKTGEYTKRVRDYGFGGCDANGATFRVRVSDPVIRAIAGMYIIPERIPL